MHRYLNFKTKHFEFINYVYLDECESRIIWEGRNDPAVRKWMETADPFSYNEHKVFIESLKNSSDKYYWAVKYEGEIIGAYILNPFNSNFKYAESGKFLFPSFQGKGFGKMITTEFLDFIFKNELLYTLYAKTSIKNYRNQHINELIGFIKIGKDEKYVYMSLTKEAYEKSNINCCRTIS